MTPIVSVSGGDMPGGSVLGVDLKPSGLRLYEFADLSIVPVQLSSSAVGPSLRNASISTLMAFSRSSGFTPAFAVACTSNTEPRISDC